MIHISIIDYQKSVMEYGCSFDYKTGILAVEIANISLAQGCFGVSVYCYGYTLLFLGKKIQCLNINVSINQ